VVSRPQSEPDSEADEPDDGIVTPPASQPWVPQQFGGRPGEPDGTAPDDTNPPGTIPPVTDPYGTNPQVTGPHVTDPPGTDPHGTDPQATDADPEPDPFGSWGTGFAAPPVANAWEAHPGLFSEPEAAPEPEPQPPLQPLQPRPQAPLEPQLQPQPWPEAQGQPQLQPEPQPPAEVPPPPPAPSNDRTETLPALGDDIFAVFDAQGRQGHQTGPAAPAAFDPYGGADDPLSHLRDEPQPHRLHLPHVPRMQMPEPRFLLMAVGSGLVVLLVLLVVLLFGDPDAGRLERHDGGRAHRRPTERAAQAERR
jgi:hypothetical protein